MKIVTLAGAATAETASLPQKIKLMEAVADLDGHSQKAEHIERARELLPLVDAERSKGFPLFHGLAAIGIWASLEAFIEDLLVTCMNRDPAFADTEGVRKLKVPLFEFEAMSGDARKQWILENLDVATGASRKPGPGRFESVLTSFGLGGTLDEEMRACLVELYAVRNLLAHRNGRVDQKFTSLCPWVGVPVGGELCVTQEMLGVYGVTAVGYGTVVTRRALGHFGEPLDAIDRMLALLPSARRTGSQPKP